MSTMVAGHFEWDSKAAVDNYVFNGVSFVEAVTVFGSPNGVHFTRGTENYLVGIVVAGIITVRYRKQRNGRTRILAAAPATQDERALLQARGPYR